jgi:hypothetical protein
MIAWPFAFLQISLALDPVTADADTLSPASSRRGRRAARSVDDGCFGLGGGSPGIIGTHARVSRAFCRIARDC